MGRQARALPPSTPVRFGVLCSWLGTGIAVALIAAAFFVPIDFPEGGADYILVKGMLFVVPAITALVVGWGIRYLAMLLRW
jgi:hypothetical protein